MTDELASPRDLGAEASATLYMYLVNGGLGAMSRHAKLLFVLAERALDEGIVPPSRPPFETVAAVASCECPERYLRTWLRFGPELWKLPMLLATPGVLADDIADALRKRPEWERQEFAAAVLDEAGAWGHEWAEVAHAGGVDMNVLVADELTAAFTTSRTQELHRRAQRLAELCTAGSTPIRAAIRHDVMTRWLSAQAPSVATAVAAVDVLVTGQLVNGSRHARTVRKGIGAVLAHHGATAEDLPARTLEQLAELGVRL